MNAFAERFVKILSHELLDCFIVMVEKHLTYLVSESIARVKQLVDGEPLMLFDLTLDATDRKNLIHDPTYTAYRKSQSQKLIKHMNDTLDPQLKAFESANGK